VRDEQANIDEKKENEKNAESRDDMKVGSDRERQGKKREEKYPRKCVRSSIKF